MLLYEPLFRALNVSGTRYVVVGGVATVLHGYARLTADIDLIVDLKESAAAKAMQALAGLGLLPRAPVDPADFADTHIRENWLREKGMQVFSLFHPDNPILSVDVFTHHPIEFNRLFDQSETCALGGISVRIASIPDLIFLKRLANRPQDRDDIEKLENIAQLRGNRDESREDT
ncbi:MAG: hypothetical protein OXC25_10565 [Thiotrichales bacterium]|nr:hypothetical protein [Thiotrichales bacterium]MCY4285609.1 hypothetical protein [Thiotrichales bacterium]MCY4350274.1 hypothetical protein [Thiotrichales bacterium]